MPPRFAYWTIILDGTPTSFRTKERDEILPLFNQLKAKNPGALLKWFSGGKLWDSPEQAREVRDVEKVRRFREQRAQQMKTEWSPGSSTERSPGSVESWSPGSLDPGSPKAHRKGTEDPLAEFRRQHGRPADGSDDPSLRGQGEGRPPSPSGLPAGSGVARKARGERREGIPGRGKDWRPGGEHKDPRDKYKLPPGESRKRWKERNLGPRVPRPFGSKPGDDRPPRADRPFGDRPRGPKPGGDRPWSPGPSRPWSPGSSDPGSPKSQRPRGPKPFGPKSGGDRPPRADRPFGDRPRGPKPFGPKSGGDRPPRTDRPFGDRPRGPKAFGQKPGGDRPRSGKPRGPKPFGGKPGGGRPRGAKPPGGPRRKG